MEFMCSSRHTIDHKYSEINVQEHHSKVHKYTNKKLLQLPQNVFTIHDSPVELKLK